MKIVDAIRRRTLEWLTATAATLAAISAITPTLVDIIISAAMVSIVWAAGKISKA